MSMSKRERIAAALRGEETDRPLVALWRHFPIDDQDPEQLAQSVVAFQAQHDWDFIKLTPASNYSVVDYGSRAVYRGHPEGVSERIEVPIQRPEDWARLEPLDPHSGALGRELACIRRVRELVGPEVPMLATVFSPLADAKHLVGRGREIVHARQHRQALQHALDVLADNMARFVAAALQAGADGIFYAVQHASATLLSEAEYRELCRPLDLHILAAAQAGSFNMLHLHGLDTYFDLVADYPVHALNWHDRDTGPSLAAGARRFPGIVSGGLSQIDIVEGDAQHVRARAADAISQMNGRRLCLSTGCVLPTVAPWGNIRALRAMVDDVGAARLRA